MTEQRQSLLQPVLDLSQQQGYWSSLYGSSKSLLFSTITKLYSRPILVLTEDGVTASRMVRELNFYIDSKAVPVLSLPSWEILPYDLLSPYQDIVSERLATLSYLPKLSSGVVVTSIATAMHRLLPCTQLDDNSLILKLGDSLQPASFRKAQIERGYRIVNRVLEPGDLAIRGALLDIFPAGAKTPYRIDLFDDEIDTIRSFDPDSQRSLGKVESIQVLPAHEVDLSDNGVACFRANWYANFAGNPSQYSIYQDVSEGLSPTGIEYYLPLFYPQTDTVFDYMPAAALIVLDMGAAQAMEDFWLEIESRYEQGKDDPERPLLPPDTLFLNSSDFASNLKHFHQIDIVSLSADSAEKENVVEYSSLLPPSLSIDARASDPLALFKRFMRGYTGRVLIVAESVGRQENLLDLFKRHQLVPEQVDGWDSFLHSDISFAITVAAIEQGAMLATPKLAVISESQLFGERVMQRRLRNRRKWDAETVIRNLTELMPGAPVVHIDYGVGRYQGLVTLDVGGIPGEFIILEYAEGDKLYIPVASLDLIGRYAGMDPEHAPLHKLGSGQWQKAKRKAREKIRDAAAALLELSARRAAQQGERIELDMDAYHAFIQDFPFEETPDQHSAIISMLEDMQQGKLMDRLICGDTGFGKTEVALRAAFAMVNNGKQVALLVPTTLLAQQHYQNFQDRFADWPVKIALLSRFRTRKEQQEVIMALSAGQIDIVIGTHRLLQSDVKFARLGLVIIDEEHRFGVRQKEKIKSLRIGVHVLALTATPIPRTLNLALSGMPDLSIITSPPSRRLAVKTSVHIWDDALIKEALLREIKRGGQVFFLHNEVKTIERIASDVAALLPEARVRAAHGQMPERELESIMFDFYHHRFNILVCTTIIETGIDVPSANTIIINRADKFGLAQLYQLRGRVGRSHHRAYAYLIVPPKEVISKDAVKRLEVIEALEDLGVGFTLATHDLEIRGAGEILGEEQSGHIKEIGFGMYMELLTRTVQTLKQGQEVMLDSPLGRGPEINLHIPSLIPEDFLPDVHMRLIMYKRIASAETQCVLDDLQEEMIDRFGLLPEPAKNLFRLAELKLKAKPMGIRKIDMAENGGSIFFTEEACIDLDSLIALIQAEPQHYRLDGQHRLRLLMTLPDAAARFNILHSLLDRIKS